MTQREVAMIDCKLLHAFENVVGAVKLHHLAVRLERVADLQRLQQLHQLILIRHFHNRTDNGIDLYRR